MMFNEVLKEIQSHNRIIIHRHHKPDGDAMGSQIGLKHLLLKTSRKRKSIWLVTTPAFTALWKDRKWTPCRMLPTKARWL